MTEEAGSLLKWSLRIYGIMGMIYGVVFLFFPGGYIAFSGSEPVAYVWMRWPGGMLIAYGMGIFLLSRRPAGQGLFVTTAASAASLMALALGYSMLVGEYTSRFSSILVATTINVVAAAFLWYAKGQSKEIL